jgi:hypothetical protein
MDVIVTRDGIVYDGNLGETKARIAGSINAYNPDGTWRPVRPRRSGIA